MKVFFHEGFKFVKNTQLKVTIFILYFYTVFGFLTSVNQDGFYHVTPAVFLENNTDPAVLFILMGFVAPSIFGCDFSYHTYKNIVPITSKKNIFFNKLLVLFTGIIGILTIDFLLNILVTLFMTGELATFSDVICLLKRYIGFYVIILFISGFLALFCMLTKSRALTYVMAVILPFSFSAIPTDFLGNTVWDAFEKLYAWNANPFNIITVILVVVMCITLLISEMVFLKREVSL